MKMIEGRLKEAQDKQKSYVDVHRVDRGYKVRDKVFLQVRPQKTQRAPLNLAKELSCHRGIWEHLKFLKERY